jgi:protein MpaA
MTSFVFGKSALGLPIQAFHFGLQGPEVLILGGVHGDEKEGVAAALGLLNAWEHSFPYHLNVTLVPRFNEDGVLLGTRGNYNGIDLNRNLPTQDWSPEIKIPRYHPGPFAGSEPENQALVEFVATKSPKFILSLHSWHPVLNVNGNCLAEAEKLSKITGYKIDQDIGYPTPGCLGTYAGLERNSPTLTYEIERGLDLSKVLKIHVPAICECLYETEKTK